MRITTTDVSPDRLATLLSLGVEAEGDEEEAGVAGLNRELLEALLGKRITLEDADGYGPCHILKRSCDELREYAGRSLGDVITSAGTSLSALRTLKDYGKALVGAAGSEPEKAAATAVYYAAIAAALVFHHQRITSLSTSQISTGLSNLIAKAWVKDELRYLYGKAVEVCRQNPL